MTEQEALQIQACAKAAIAAAERLDEALHYGSSEVRDLLKGYIKASPPYRRAEGYLERVNQEKEAPK